MNGGHPCEATSDATLFLFRAPVIAPLLLLLPTSLILLLLRVLLWLQVDVVVRRSSC
jgi:hypothetical protein